MRGLDTDRLAAVSKKLGEAALDPSRWTMLMEEMCPAVGTAGAVMIQSEIRTRDVPMTDTVTEMFESYFDQNLHVNDVRAIRGVPLLMAGSPVICDQDLFASEREMLRDPLYANAYRYGFCYWAAVRFKAESAL